jgi:hypothetical protein
VTSSWQDKVPEEGRPRRPKPAEASPRADRPPPKTPTAPPSAIGNAAAERLGGAPLEPSTRARLERSLGGDLSEVRLHRDPAAGRVAEALDATAVTSGRDIFFGPDAPQAGTAAGDRLVAHEAAHALQQAEGMRVERVSTPPDRSEVSAGLAADAAVAGLTPSTPVVAGAAVPEVQRQPKGATEEQELPKPEVKESAVETAVAAFLRRCWDRQSKGQKPFKVDAAVRDGLSLVFGSTPAGMATIEGDLFMEPGSPTALMDKIRSKLPTSVPAEVFDALNALPGPEKKKPEEIEGPSPSKEDDPVVAALTEAARRFLKTKPGQELAQKAKEFFLSQEGIPLVAMVVGGAITFIAANDARIPSTPGIPLPGGIKLTVDISARPSELGPLLDQIGGGPPPTAEPGGTKPPETKVGLTLKGNIEDIPKFLAAVGDFFVMVGKGIASGAVWLGRTIVVVGKAILPELLATLGGAAAGALIGLAAGGGIGAAIGAAIGAGAGLLGALTVRLIRALRD